MKTEDVRTVLITGIAGSGGSYLAEYISHNYPQVRIHGISRWHSNVSLNNIHEIREKVKVHECDLTDTVSILNTLKICKPDIIFHLASYANVRASFQTPLSVIQNNIMGTANLFEAIKHLNLNPRILLCSTSEVYGQVKPNEIPILETSELRPASPYAVSKVTQDLLGYTYFLSYQMDIVRTRMFAYLNPRRTDLFATAFARQIARIEVGLQKELTHGNLDSVRTIIDVRDAMSAYWIAACMCSAGEVYNIGGDKIIKVGEFLDLLKSMAKVPITTKEDPALLRPSDVTLQIPSTEKFTKQTEWKSIYTFEESVRFLLDYWRKEVAKDVIRGS